MIPQNAAMTTTVPSTSASSRSNTGKIALLLVIGLAIGAFFYFDLGRFLSLGVVKENRDKLLAFTEANYAIAVGLFIVVYAAVTGLSVPGAAILTLAGGFLFGSLFATAFVNVGATTGATLAFLAARYLLRDWVEHKFGKWLGPFQEECVQLFADSKADSNLSFLRRKPRVGPHAGQCRDLCCGHSDRYRSRLVCICLCGTATRNDQLAQGRRIAERPHGICASGVVGAGAEFLQEVERKTGMTS